MLPASITAYLEEQGISEADRSDPLATFDALKLDALARQEIAMLIEEDTGKDVPDTVFEGWNTLGDVAETALWFAGEVA